MVLASLAWDSYQYLASNCFHIYPMQIEDLKKNTKTNKTTQFCPRSCKDFQVHMIGLL